MGALLAAVMRGGELFLICRNSRCTSLFKSCYVVAPIDDSGGPSAKMTTRSEPAHHSPSLPARFFRLRPESEPRMYRLLPVEALNTYGYLGDDPVIEAAAEPASPFSIHDRHKGAFLKLAYGRLAALSLGGGIWMTASSEPTMERQ